MSLKKKDPSQPGGLRVAADDPHLVSLGGGRLSTAVTIHHLPIGDTSIGSSLDCSVVLNGSGVQHHHCTLYRSENGEVTLVPEHDVRILIDGKKIDGDATLTQGAMLTIGKSNYLRFNNPAEAQLLKSTIGSNERISMPQIDFNQDSSGSSNEGTPDDMLKNLQDILQMQNYNKPQSKQQQQPILKDKLQQPPNNETILEKMTKNDFTNINNFHSPKVFTADSITVNAPAKDVLGAKFNNFTKNLTQIFSKNDKNNQHKGNNNFTQSQPSLNSVQSTTAKEPANESNGMLVKVNNVPSATSTPTSAVNSPKIQQFSACYDRYPKPGSYGSLQVFPMNGINSEINNSQVPERDGLTELQRQRAQIERMQEQEISKLEHDRLEEILRMCADFERQNQNVQSSPIVQNRIKTNGSLPRDKKAFANNSDFEQSHQNLFFPHTPTDDRIPVTKSSSGYENVKIMPGGRVELSSSSSVGSSQQHQASNEFASPNGSVNGYENVFSPKKSGYVPQSPRTKIKTCVSPKKENPAVKKSEYDLLVQSFEDKLRMEIQLLRENKNFDSLKAQKVIMAGDSTQLSKQHEPIYGTLEKRNKNVNNLKLNIKKDMDLKKIDQLKSDRKQVLSQIRELKTQIADLQRQEEEVLRELDMEKALVTAELATEQAHLLSLQRNISTLQTKIHRLEAQHNSSRIMQETQQNRLRQSIEVKQNQVEGLEDLIKQNGENQSMLDDLNATIESLENDTKTFEDLEFQYLEEETDWLAYREELQHDLRTLTKIIDDKHVHIHNLETQGINNQQTACTDTRAIEKELWLRLSEMEKRREELKEIDRKIFDISGQQNSQSDSDEEDVMEIKRVGGGDIMSQSLFGSQEILSSKPKDQDIMSKSVNENMFFTNNNIEMPSPFTSTPKRNVLKQIDISDDITKITQNGHDKLREAEEQQQPSIAVDPMLKLKYNLSPPFQHKTPPVPPQFTETAAEEMARKARLNLSIESDDFEVNPLEKRVPSQDDIDRICKVTLDAPISTQGASYKVIESIKEIERNRQLLLAQQGSHVIEHERQKMNELKKKSHDEARAQYLQLQSISTDSDSYAAKDRSLENVSQVSLEQQELNNKPSLANSPKRELISSPQRHSHPDFDRTRPLSETNSELSYDALSEKPFKSSNDIRSSSNRLNDNGLNSGNSGMSPKHNNYGNNQHSHQHRNSQLSQSDTTSESGGRMISGNKRNLPKHQRPLTRYLPIMSLDLDLRQHIESAGHQVTLCPHVLVDSYSCRGYLHKLGATFHGWSRRWFVFDRQKMALIYYSDKSERKPRGGAYFSTIDEVYLDHMNTSKSGRPYCTFIVKTKKRSYHLQAASDAAARIWIDAIITGAQGNIDY